jgi:glutathione S-transferase
MIVVHHLAYSRSHRILWLLEELGLPYEIVRYERDANFRAPPELAKVHPMGKSPVIVDGELTLGESAVILSYINARYGGGRLAPPAGSIPWYAHEEWLQYAESTAAFPIMMMRIGAIAGGLSEGMANFIKPVLGRTLNHIGAAVSAHEWLTGPDFTLADIQIAYPLEMASSLGVLDAYAPVLAYRERLAARPAFVKAVEIGGPMLPVKK